MYMICVALEGEGDSGKADTVFVIVFIFSSALLKIYLSIKCFKINFTLRQFTFDLKMSYIF